MEPVAPIHTTAAEIYSGLDTPCTVVPESTWIGFQWNAGGFALLMMHLLDLSIGGTGMDESALHVLEIRGFSRTEERLAGHLVKFIDRAFSSAWAGVARDWNMCASKQPATCRGDQPQGTSRGAGSHARLEKCRNQIGLPTSGDSSAGVQIGLHGSRCEKEDESLERKPLSACGGNSC